MKLWRFRISLQNGVKIIAIFETIICIVAIVPTTLIMLDVCLEGKLGMFIQYAFGVPRTVQLLMWLVFWTAITVKLILDINLYRGAINKNYEATLIWLMVTGAVLITYYIWGVLSLNMLRTKRDCLTVVLTNVGIGVCKGLEMVTVYKFMQSMKKSGRLQLFHMRTTSPLSITDFGFDHYPPSTGIHYLQKRKSATGELESDERKA